MIKPLIFKSFLLLSPFLLWFIISFFDFDVHWAVVLWDGVILTYFIWGMGQFLMSFISKEIHDKDIFVPFKMMEVYHYDSDKKYYIAFILDKYNNSYFHLLKNYWFFYRKIDRDRFEDEEDLVKLVTKSIKYYENKKSERIKKIDLKWDGVIAEDKKAYRRNKRLNEID